MSNRLIMGIIFMFVLILVAGCSSNTASAPEKAAAPEKVTYNSDVKEIIANNCLSCHGSDSPTMAEFDLDKEGYKSMMKGPRLSDYENLLVVVNGTDAGALMRRLDDGKSKEDGKPGNMYVNLGKTDEERAANLEIMKKWVGSWNLKKVDELTPDELAAITAPEE